MKQQTGLAVALGFALLFSGAMGTQFVHFAAGNPEESASPVLAMPVEYVNYTIVRVNGSLWAKIDGTYPIYILNQQCVGLSELPMLYPTPPGTTNIRVQVNGTELEWSNYTEVYPDSLHHTAIGNWSMIYCVVSPVSDFFMLTIHYEHPVAMVNGSNLFLYDLNISPYLTASSSTSIAYFTVRFETTVSDVRAYTTWTDSVWNPKNLTLSCENGVEMATIQMRSVLGEPLAGDLVVMFNNYEEQEVPHWLIIVPVFAVAGFLAAIVYRKKRR
ncbi:hypothetical protein G4O51_07195 [Candidatus Bathyarchaeota archaeon A05DMB-2]|nr:hypothetical protein [Candidatus Bathyarchaeota archaeon A05DMB-2]